MQTLFPIFESKSQTNLELSSRRPDDTFLDFAGHSMSVGMARRYALAHPERIEALPLVSAGDSSRPAPARSCSASRLRLPMGPLVGNPWRRP
jgi:hypothetical protein